MNLKGTETERNLLTAFAGESQARNRYTYCADQAREEGYEQMAAIFEETANQEREHAKRLFKFLPGGESRRGRISGRGRRQVGKPTRRKPLGRTMRIPKCTPLRAGGGKGRV
jgi:rubrerythrin